MLWKMTEKNGGCKRKRYLPREQIGGQTTLEEGGGSHRAPIFLRKELIGVLWIDVVESRIHMSP